ncbi:MAG TPA: NAD(P)-dependent oxidoreductase [Burkholderiales bacterium]|nr:NAD(P)-dependent oxidoreductase [Burkholderiales bacterium]
MDTQRKPALGFIGLGQMGEPMVRRLLAAGFPVAVWNRSSNKVAPALEHGARAAASPAELARGADIVMTCVTDQRALEAVLFSPQGVAEGGGHGKLVVDFSSIAPDAARAFALRLERLGMGLVDAPVSGGVPGAEKGTLVVMAGGREEHVERVRPVLAHLASRVTRMGESGAGQATKLCNQIIVGALLPVLAEAVRLAEAAGVDATRLPEALKGGFADSAPLQIFGARMATRQFEPRLAAAALLKKDLENAAALARERGVTLPMVSAASELYRLLEAQGRVQQDPSVLIELLR